MSKRVRGARDDVYRWLKAAGIPNTPQFGTIGDYIAPTPFVTVGGLIVITADVNTTDIDPSDTYRTELMQYYNPIGDLQRSGFMPIGCAVLVGEPYIDATPPTGNVGGKFILSHSTISDGANTTVWRSVAMTLNGSSTRQILSSMSTVASDVQMTCNPIGANSYNFDTAGPFDQMNIGIENQSGSVTIGAGTFRVVVWGLEF